jgi:hypothetical protein
VGHVIAYEYLWASQENATEDGRAAYPAAIIMARDDLGPAPIAYALGISHSPPKEGQRAMLMPPKLKRHLGLDDEPSWIYTDQLNVFVWPGPDLRPAELLSTRPDARGTCVISALPVDWFAEVQAHLQESYRLKKVYSVKRTE